MKQMLISLLFADRYYKIYIRIAWNLIAQRLERMRGIFGNADKEGRRNEEMQKRNKYLSSSSENMEQVKALLTELAGAEMTVQKMRAILAGCAEGLLKQRFAKEDRWRYRWLIEELEKCGSGSGDTEKDGRDITGFTYIDNEDLLGFLYLSLRALKERKKSGSYYTPEEIAKKLTKECPTSVRILDPACGTGSILLELPGECQLQHIYGYDIDPIAIAIVRVNMALRYQVFDKELLTEHFQIRDFLKEGSRKTVDVLLGNPPWGVGFSEKEKALLRGKFLTAGQKAVESGDLFVEQGLKVLRPGGRLCFVLPEALLHVKTHRQVRSLLLEQSNIRRVEYLGEVFDKVQCPSVILEVEKRTGEKTGKDIAIITEKRRFMISSESSGQGLNRFSEEGFLLEATEEEFAVLRKLSTIQNAVSLKGRAKFALGIVTGNNAKHLLKEAEERSESVLRGSDIEPFRIKEATAFIRFAPEKYQQVAPLALYRAPEKLLYRFVGAKPVFAYDDRQRLTLNSCNIVIPEVEGMDMRYIMAVFNSSVTEFWHRRVNHSMKLLRTQIEGFPIPAATQKQQQEIIGLAEQSDAKVVALFGLTDTEYALVRQACNR